MKFIFLLFGTENTDPDPDWEVTSVAQAVKTYPKPVFSQWLRFRRASADKLAPVWREGTRKEKVELLECSAFLMALRN